MRINKTVSFPEAVAPDTVKSLFLGLHDAVLPPLTSRVRSGPGRGALRVLQRRLKPVLEALILTVDKAPVYPRVYTCVSVNVRVYLVCVCLYMHMCTSLYYTYMYVSTCVYAFVCLHVCVSVNMCMHVYM